MNNADVIEQLDALTGEVQLLRNDLVRSEDAPPLPTATALVKLVKFNRDFAALSRAAKKSLAPLYGRQDDEGQADGEKPKPRPKR